MPKLKIDVPHKLTRQEAEGRIKNLLSETAKKFQDKITNLEENWSGGKGTFSFKAAGFAVSGTLEVKDQIVVLDGNLPLAAVFFKTKIESKIREEASRLLA